MTFSPITIQVGILPVIVVPDLRIKIGVDGYANAGISTSIQNEFHFEAGSEFISGTGWQPYKTFTNNFNYGPPTLTANCGAKAYIKPEINMAVYGVLAGYAYGEAYGKLEADLLQSPWWKLYVGYNLGVGARAEILGHELFDFVLDALIHNELLVAQASGTPPTVTTTAITNITSNSATCGGNVTAQGSSTVTARGVCWSTSQNPTTVDSKTTNGTGTGSFTSSITGLSPATPYYVRAYATNSAGTSYGGQVSFTSGSSGTPPTVTTIAITNITSNSATSGGNVTAQGSSTVTARGVCWSTSQNPTITNSKTTDGTGTGSFTSTITGLSPSTPYYVRAYATNSAGTSYGSQVSFTTTSSGTTPPMVTTTSITNITSNSATSGGNVTAQGSSTVTARGVCWSTSQNPTTVDSKTTNGTGTGSFTSSITGLNPSTPYYVRAYATNSAGTSYGSQVSFATSAGAGGVPCPGIPTVTYGGKTYNTVEIGAQCWLRENLDIGTIINGNQTQTNNSTLEKYCFSDNPANCAIYGGLYQWNEAMQYVTLGGTQGICPNGWHIPTLSEYQILIAEVNNDGNKLKEIGQGQGTNISGFSALLAGDRDYNGNFTNFGSNALFWTSTENNASSSNRLNLNSTNSIDLVSAGSLKVNGFSIRCIKD